MTEGTDLVSLLAGLPVDELLLLGTYRKLDPDLKDDTRRFISACLRQQHVRHVPDNVVAFPLKAK